ncbi:hypothetical protein AMAG_09952 [Allomyces macrogynus ATCC 38327]|uniref:Thiopurine S-methyltransferase n=1 Tax=Allomyces macrogynus (strain ATCC 38327) TaxID=578462 RepID=A0A0L0SQH0_ALLM3|nr:hypothetical protein AMAG_09952 [Allomyces macrogynus ATCC 38327]|eukprot:KNE64595.1 hypothetical protein AMAG_09952 [Allomyces macrogynus ATCC 38327]
MMPATQKSLAEESAAITSHWERSWQAPAQMWDNGLPPPALIKVVNEGRVPTGRVLVPGCGGGYDLPVLASPSRFALGLDVSSIAVNKAHETLRTNNVPEDQAAVIKADFFTFTNADLPPQLVQQTVPAPNPKAAPQFDAMFDYTFLCSFPPAWRRRWATRTAELIKPGGILITLMCPLAVYRGGPPYALSVKIYRALMRDDFEELEMNECESLPGNIGVEMLALWRRKEAGATSA